MYAEEQRERAWKALVAERSPAAVARKPPVAETPLDLGERRTEPGAGARDRVRTSTT